MTTSYESQRFIDDLTRRYHQRTGKYPTKSEVTYRIRRMRMVNLPPARTYWSREWAKQRTFSRFIALELIRRIQESDEDDPIRIIFSVYDWMDEILCSEEHGRMAWQFANSMKDAISEVLDLLD